MSSDNSKFKRDFVVARKLVNELDACGFIKFGSPEDEYDAMSHALLSGIYNGEPTDLIKSRLIKLLDEYYGAFDTAVMKPDALKELHVDLDRTVGQALTQIEKSNERTPREG